MTTVVVGARGFIGSRLARALRRDGDVVEITRRESLDAVPRSVLRDVSDVYFVAGSVTPATASTRQDLVSAELDTFGRVVDVLSHVGSRPRLVLASSGGTVYTPDHAPPYTEDSPTAPSCAYGVMKRQMERLLLDRLELLPVILRLGNVYGPGQPIRRGQGVISHWLAAARASQPLRLYGDPNSTRDYIYVDDVVELLRRVHHTRDVPPILNVGSGIPTALGELAKLVVEAVNQPWLTIDHRPSRTTDRAHVWLTSERARRAMCWRPVVSLSEGLCRTWRSFAAANLAEDA